MISPANSPAAVVVALALVVTGTADAFAQSRLNEHPTERAVVAPRPPMRPQQNLIVPPIAGQIVAPIGSPVGSPYRNAVPLPPPVPSHPFEHDRDHDRDRAAFAAGVAAGVVIGAGAVAAPAPDYGGADCTQFPSYDARSGTYVGADGILRPCP